MNARSGIMTIVLAAFAATAWAQCPPPVGEMMGQPPPPMRHGGLPPMPFGKQFDPMREDLFPPELVMQNQKALGLSDEQKTVIKEAMQKSMAKFTDLMWQQSAEQETMDSLLKSDRLDEAKVIPQLDKLLGIENEMKRTLFGMLLKVKNCLTPDQLTKLRSIRQAVMQPSQGDQRSLPPDDKRGAPQPPKP